MFEGKVALVTGAGKGIGKEIALELARGGAKCVINYASSATGAESVAEEIRAMGSEAMTYKCIGCRCSTEDDHGCHGAVRQNRYSGK